MNPEIGRFQFAQVRWGDDHRYVVMDTTNGQCWWNEGSGEWHQLPKIPPYVDPPPRPYGGNLRQRK
jgi:hypothetical protein